MISYQSFLSLCVLISEKQIMYVYSKTLNVLMSRGDEKSWLMRRLSGKRADRRVGAKVKDGPPFFVFKK